MSLVYYNHLTLIDMAKTKKKLREQQRNKAQERKFFTIAFAVTAILVVLIFFIFMRS